MLKTKQDFIQKTPLLISISIVVPTSLFYGFNPSLQFDIQPNTMDEHNLLKAIMGLYLGFSLLWLLGVFKTNYLKIALMTNMIFMLGLGFGRVLSILMDGTPTFGYVFGTFAELFLGTYTCWVLTNKNTNFAEN